MTHLEKVISKIHRLKPKKKRDKIAKKRILSELKGIEDREEKRKR